MAWHRAVAATAGAGPAVTSDASVTVCGGVWQRPAASPAQRKRHVSDWLMLLQWLTVFKNICCFLWLLSFLGGFSVKTVTGMLYNPLWGSWSWTGSTSLNYAVHAVKAGAQGHATDTPPETDIQQHSATAGTAGTAPDGPVWRVVMDCHQNRKWAFTHMDTIKPLLTMGFLFASIILALFLAKYLGQSQKNQVPAISGIF